MKVRIKSRLDKDCVINDYRFGFTQPMLRQFGGKIVTIIDRHKNYMHLERYNHLKTSDDGYLYRIKEDDNFFCWASSMFEEIIDETNGITIF